MFWHFNTGHYFPQLYRMLLFVITVTFVNKLAAQIPAIVNDSITIAVAPGYDSVSGFHRFWLGESYRKLWAAPVKMRVLYLTSEKGGLTIERQGGGLQTRSLRLKDRKGKQYILRTVQKYPERKLPDNLKQTIAKDILQDQVVTGHPYAALAVSPFEAALGIPHTTPEIVFVADDTALGDYRKEFANAVYLFEERAPTDTLKTVNTTAVQEKVEGDNDFTIDQKLVLRARLLDMFLGNWDRHEDQWQWERRRVGNVTIYAPVPRDMDAVYYNTTGVFPWIISNQWLKSRFQGLHKNIRDIEGFNSNNQYFDRYFLTHLDAADWKEQLEFFNQSISDSLIKAAIKMMPDTIYNLSGQWLINTLIHRKNNLEESALKYYRFISKYVDLPATNKNEIVNIDYKVNGHVAVTGSKIKKDGTVDHLIFHREFDPAVTKEIRLYGLSGKDIFNVMGSGTSAIQVRLIGGDGRDSFYIQQPEKKRKLKIYDRFDQENFIPARGARIRLSTDSSVNNFVKRYFKYDQVGPLAVLNYNIDQGIQIKAGLLKEKQGFRKEPYASRRELTANYSTGRKSWMFTYAADIKKIFGKTDLVINLLSRGPHNISNFFGIGNEARFIKDETKGISYYRSKYDYFTGDVRLKFNPAPRVRLTTGIVSQYYTSSSKNNTNRFLKDYDIVNRDKNVFDNRLYAGLIAGLEVNTRNDRMLPSKGFYINADVKAMSQLGGQKASLGQVAAYVDFYQPVSNDSTIVLATRVGGGTVIGKPSFFQQMQLGGVQNLRGYHSIRFTGKTMFYHNLDLRLKLFDFVSYLLPGTVGLVGFNDIGRVWVPGERSSKWHDGYGGGIYVVPADVVLVQALVGHSKEGTQPYISIGFSF